MPGESCKVNLFKKQLHSRREKQCNSNKSLQIKATARERKKKVWLLPTPRITQVGGSDRRAPQALWGGSHVWLRGLQAARLPRGHEAPASDGDSRPGSLTRVLLRQGLGNGASAGRAPGWGELVRQHRFRLRFPASAPGTARGEEAVTAAPLQGPCPGTLTVQLLLSLL